MSKESNTLLLYRAAPLLNIPERAWCNQDYIGIPQKYRISLTLMAHITKESIYRILPHETIERSFMICIARIHEITGQVLRQQLGLQITETDKNKFIFSVQGSKDINYYDWNTFVVENKHFKDLIPSPGICDKIKQHVDMELTIKATTVYGSIVPQ